MIYIKGLPIEFIKFPNGEITFNHAIVWRRMNNDGNGLTAVLTLHYENDEDLINLMFVKHFLDQQGAWCCLRLAYMPYSRMDRSVDGSPFTLKSVADFINWLNFDRVDVYEPHSDVTPALLNNSSAHYPTVDIFHRYVCGEGYINPETDYVFFPDAGAQKRYQNKIAIPNELVGLKKRDFATGTITGLQVVGEIKEPGFKVVIIDDLCSRGGTFMLAARQLKELGASNIYLLLGHCEDTIFEGEVLGSNLITGIFTTNSILTKRHPKIRVFNLEGEEINE